LFYHIFDSYNIFKFYIKELVKMGVHVNGKGVKGPSIVKVLSNKRSEKEELKKEEAACAVVTEKKPQPKVAEEKEQGWSIANILKAKEEKNNSEANKRKEKAEAMKKQRERILKDRVVVDLGKK
jgi:hypothetical protein